MAQVSVNRGALVAMGLSLATSLVVLAFLLGREAGRRGAAPAAAPARSAVSDPAGAGASQAPSQGAPPTPALAAAPLDLQLPVGPADPTDPQRGAVQAYFQALDRIAPDQLGGDPQALARELVGGLARGDASGFDGLLARAEEARVRAAALAPPPACAGFHRESLALLDENLELLKGVRRGLDGGEGEGGPAGLAARAQGLQVRAEALARAESALRARYGLGK